jgi:hypothetical protein
MGGGFTGKVCVGVLAIAQPIERRIGANAINFVIDNAINGVAYDGISSYSIWRIEFVT